MPILKLLEGDTGMIYNLEVSEKDAIEANKSNSVIQSVFTQGAFRFLTRVPSGIVLSLFDIQ